MADRLCREYFELIPMLRAVLVIMAFRRHTDASFAYLAILYRREHGQIMVADVVSCGTAPLDQTTAAFLQRNGMPPVRLLPFTHLGVPSRIRSSP